MGDVVDELLARADVTAEEPSSSSDIDTVRDEFDAPLPELLIKLWRQSDGLMCHSLDAHIPGPTEILELLQDDSWEQEWVERGLLPILDDHQSNYLTVSLREPLAFRVVHLPHDDGSRLLYRDFESCIEALMNAADQGESAEAFLYETEGDYPPDAPRTEEDQEAARALIAERHERDEWNHAVRLLDAAQLDEWARLLETDHFVRRDVRERMKKMTDPSIRELLRKDEQAFESFANTVADAARRAGLPVGRREQDALQIGDRWMNLIRSSSAGIAQTPCHGSSYGSRM